MIGSSLQANGYDGQLPTSLIACIWIVEESAVICSEELRNGKDRLRSCGMEVYEARLFFFKQADDRATLWVFKTKNSFGRNKRGHKITRLVRGQRIQSYVVLKVLSAASP